MATLEQIIYNIAENVKREHDQPFLERLRFMVPNYRATLLRRDDAKGRRLDAHFLQTLEEVNMEEFPNPFNERCLLLRSSFKIPNPVRLISGPAIRAVTSLDGSRILHPIEYEAVRTISYGKFTGHEPRYYYRQGYIWLINSTTEAIAVEAAFSDPHEAELFNNPSADLFEMEYPVPLDFVQAITELILKIEATPDDPVNDDVVINE